MRTETIGGQAMSKAIRRRSARPLTLGILLRRLRWILIQAFLWLFAISVVFPMVWTLITSLKTAYELWHTPWSLPAVPQWDNYVRAWSKMQVGIFFFNSVKVTAISLFGVMMLGSMLAYALARYEFRGRNFIILLLSCCHDDSRLPRIYTGLVSPARLKTSGHTHRIDHHVHIAEFAFHRLLLSCVL